MTARAVCCAMLVFAACKAREPVLMPDWFVDSADVLTVQEEYELIEQLLGFYERTQVELAGVTVENLGGQTIEAYTAELFDTWELGTPQTNNGLMVVLALDERQVHIARGMGMAWEMPQSSLDSVAARMATEFGEGRYAAGFESGLTELMGMAEAVPWSVEYLSLQDIIDDGEAAVDRIAALDAELTGFDDDQVIITDPAGLRAILHMPTNVPLLSVEDLLGIHARVVSISPLELQVLGLEVDEPL